MRETVVETRLQSKTKKLGGHAWKWVSPGTRGVPDRIVLLPGGKIIFVETKAPGKKPEPIQEYRIKQLRELGFQVEILDSKEDVDKFIQEVSHGI